MPSGIQPGGSFERLTERLTGLDIVGIAVVVADTLVGVVAGTLVGVVGALVALVPRLGIVVVGRCLVSCCGEGGRIRSILRWQWLRHLQLRPLL
jgi:hypothetical protein